MNDEQKQEIKAQSWYILARACEKAGKMDAAQRCHQKWQEQMPKEKPVEKQQHAEQS